MGVRALVNMYVTSTLIKQCLFDSLKHETVDEPKALLPSIMIKYSFSMEVKDMTDSNQPYMIIIDRDLISQLQLKPDIVKNTIQSSDNTVPMVIHGYWKKNR